MAKRVPPARAAGLFADGAPEAKPATAAHRANIDGGSRGNPGPAAYGVVIRDAKGDIVAKLKKYIGRMTNNVAEYYGLIAALDYAESQGIRALRIEADSELMVKQMRGVYKVRSPELQPLFERARKMAAALESFRIDHVYREQNREADALANEAMDEVENAAPKSAKLAAIPTPKKAEARGPIGEVRKIRARYRSGVLYLLEDVDLPDGTEVDVLLRLLPPKTT
jgi:ribonuclease HI